jgi:hypothetical protein
VACDLRLGVRREKDELQAHAWVERDGVALNDAPDVSRRYAAFQPADLKGATRWV